jgi:hypothetical protein
VAAAALGLPLHLLPEAVVLAILLLHPPHKDQMAARAMPLIQQAAAEAVVALLLLAETAH